MKRIGIIGVTVYHNPKSDKIEYGYDASEIINILGRFLPSVEVKDKKPGDMEFWDVYIETGEKTDIEKPIPPPLRRIKEGQQPPKPN